MMCRIVPGADVCGHAACEVRQPRPEANRLKFRVNVQIAAEYEYPATAHEAMQLARINARLRVMAAAYTEHLGEVMGFPWTAQWFAYEQANHLWGVRHIGTGATASADLTVYDAETLADRLNAPGSALPHPDSARWAPPHKRP